jgi:membrane protein
MRFVPDPRRIVRFVWFVFHQTVARWSRNDGNVLAASMAYYAAFSFFPLLLVLISALGFALKFSANAQNAQTQLLEFLAQNTNPALAEEVANILAEVQTRAPLNGLVGWLTLLLGAIGIFSQLEAAFDRLWHDTTPHAHGVWAAVRNALGNRLKAFLTLIGLGLLIIVSFVIGLMFAAVRTWAEEISWAEKLVGNGYFWHWSQLALSTGLNALVLALVYKMIPRAGVRIVHAACAGVVVAIVWQLGSQLVSRFIVGGNYSAYGVVGSFIAMMLWVYCASILLLLGAQMVQVLGHPENNSLAPAPPSIPPKS